jgi:hypothetical protein
MPTWSKTFKRFKFEQAHLCEWRPVVVCQNSNDACIASSRGRLEVFDSRLSHPSGWATMRDESDAWEELRARAWTQRRA